MSSKKCSKCGEEKGEDMFYFDTRKQARYAHCKVCQSAISKKTRESKIESGELKVLWRNISMSPAEKLACVELYEAGVGCHRIAKKIGFSKPAVMTFLKKVGVLDASRKYRKHKFINENYFDEIDSDDKAYFLGLLWADGCNFRSDNGKNRGYQIQISLQEKDGYIIRQLAEKIFENDNIVRFVDNSKKKPNQIAQNKRPVEKVQNSVVLHIPSKHISNVLNEYGMVPRKSLILEMPSIELNEDNFRSFTRGYLDGDGWVSETNSRHAKSTGTSHKVFTCGMVGSYAQMEQMKSRLNDLGFSFIQKDKGKISRITLSGNLQVLRFLDWLYDNASVKLNRKYEKYLKLKSQSANNPKSKFNKKRKFPYQNICINHNSFAVCLQHKGVKHNKSFTTLEAAIKLRDELRAQYGLMPAIDRLTNREAMTPCESGSPANQITA